MQKKVEAEEVGSEAEQNMSEHNESKPAEVTQRGRQLDGVTIFCQLCSDYLCHSVTTACQHTYCELCLAEYLLYLDECPICRTRIRHQKQASNILLDNLILDYIKRFEPQQLSEYERRLQEYKSYKRRRTLPQLQAGMQVDIRDTDYVWCTGKVHRTVNKFQDRKVKFVIVKYDKSTKKEQIAQTSPRLAPKGFFTAREEIPKYQRGKLVLKNVEEGVTYLISKESEQDSEEQKGQ